MISFSGQDHLQLIFDHAKWVIDMDPADGLKVREPVTEELLDNIVYSV